MPQNSCKVLRRCSRTALPLESNEPKLRFTNHRRAGSFSAAKGFRNVVLSQRRIELADLRRVHEMTPRRFPHEYLDEGLGAIGLFGLLSRLFEFWNGHLSFDSSDSPRSQIISMVKKSVSRNETVYFTVGALFVVTGMVAIVLAGWRAFGYLELPLRSH